MKKITGILLGVGFACTASAALVDFTAAGDQGTLLTYHSTNNGGLSGTPSLLAQSNVALGSGVTADISVTTGNGNAYVTSANAGLGVNTSAATSQLGVNQLLIFSFSNVLLNGEALAEGTTVNFDLNRLLWTAPSVGGFVFDGSNNLPSGANVGVDGVDPSTISAGQFLDPTSANGTAGSVSNHDLAFSTYSAAETYELAPNQVINFSTDFRVRGYNPPDLAGNNDNFYLQGFDISVNVIPEPATLGLVTAFGGSILLGRRFFMV
ncbi:hypothetical protein P4C99_20945 [Pontiellaceae bacterium B1224]|nr:hypothetical protein [Pontiellaceae bacterium B1224]